MSEPSISITLPASQWHAIGSALSELPFKVAQPIILAIGQQMQAHDLAAQQAAQADAPAAAADPSPEPAEPPQPSRRRK